MQSVRNLFNTNPNKTSLPDEESSPLLSSHTEHHTLNPRLISDIILVRLEGDVILTAGAK